MAGIFTKRIWQPCICQPNEFKREIKKKLGAIGIGVREGILLGGAEKFCPESNFFSLIRMGPETSCKSVLYS